MTRIVKIWYRTSFWARIEKSFLYVGSTVTGSMVLAEADKVWTLVVIGSTVVGGVVSLWFNDENKDGIADIFEEK